MVNKKKVLLQIPSCPYCAHAREALDAKGVTYDIIDIDPNDRSLVQSLSGQPSVPILLEVIGSNDQDDDIIEYLNELQD